MEDDSGSTRVAPPVKTYLLNTNLGVRPRRIVVRGEHHSYELQDGSTVYDASCGAGVANLGRTNEEVMKAMVGVMEAGLSYVPSSVFDTLITERLAQTLVESTGGQMRKAIFYGSGSEAVEAALKVVTQYHDIITPLHRPRRTKFIAREQSYHGATLGALDLSGHEARKALYQFILPQNMHLITSCHPYRNRLAGENDEQYVARKKSELRDKIIELGRDEVSAVIFEPVVGAALGCVPAVPGYLAAMKDVCNEFGVLMILDEVMCGIGRTGYLHAWQEQGVVPDIQLIGKGLAGGFQPISCMLIGHRIAEGLEKGPSNGAFIHGHTFQNHTVGAAAAQKVIDMLQRQDSKGRTLLDNVKDQGNRLEQGLRDRLSDHRYVGDIRGVGLFWGIEFVEDKETKRPFDSTRMIHDGLYQLGLESGVHFYHGGGSVDGRNGDHIMIMPAFDIDDSACTSIVNLVGEVVERFFVGYDSRARERQLTSALAMITSSCEGII